MRVADARVAAVDWLRAQRGQLDGLVGAYLGGSLAGLDGDAVVPDASDVDVMVVLTDPPPAKLGKFRHQGALLEVTYVDSIAVSDPETVLADYHLAGPFRYPSAILLDDQGALRSVQAAVAAGFGHRRWAERRARHAYDRARNGLLQLDTALDPPSLHLAWLFPTGVTTHVLLSAALRNPTIRLRYLRAREALDAHGRGDAYPELLAQLGVEQLTQRQVRHHLHSMAKAFDAAAAVLSRPASTRSRGLPFTSDLTPAARPVAVDGAAELIDRGDHREAMFWIAATFARCHWVFATDDPDLRPRHDGAFEALRHDLGVGSPDAYRERAHETLGYLPTLWGLAEEILTSATTNPTVERGS